MTGRDVREARKRRGWSQKSLANRLGVSQPLMASVEAGNRRITVRLEMQLKALMKELRDVDSITGESHNQLDNNKIQED